MNDIKMKSKASSEEEEVKSYVRVFEERRKGLRVWLGKGMKRNE